MLLHMLEEHIGEQQLLVPIASRIPGSLFKRIGDEASERDITVSQHVAAVIISAYEDSDLSNGQVELLLKENRLLREELAKKEALLQQGVQKAKSGEQKLQVLEAKYETHYKVLDALLKNEAILEKLYSKYGTSPFGKQELEKESFLFHLMVGRVVIEQKPYHTLFNYGYTLVEKDLIQIRQINTSLLLNA